MSECPCGTGNDLATCCGRFLDNGEEPTTAEELMRARYTAHTCDRMDFVKQTHHPETVAEFDENTAKAWAGESTWLKLDVVNVEGGQGDDDEGTVEFVAHYNDAAGAHQHHHELSVFNKVDGSWKFRDGGAPRNAEPFVRTEPRIGRNDPCHCGSGKKFKKCCG